MPDGIWSLVWDIFTNNIRAQGDGHITTAMINALSMQAGAAPLLQLRPRVLRRPRDEPGSRDFRLILRPVHKMSQNARPKRSTQRPQQQSPTSVPQPAQSMHPQVMVEKGTSDRQVGIRPMARYTGNN